MSTSISRVNPICAVAAAPQVQQMKAQFVQAWKRTKSIELRLDWLEGDAEIARFLNWLGSRTWANGFLLATCRRVEAGGRYKGTIAKQLFHLAQAIRAGCDWYDLEVETSRQCQPELINVMLGEGRQLASAHFFDAMPKNLAKVAADLRRTKPEATKIAAHCDSLAEGLKLLEFGRRQRNMVAIPMGEVSMPLRLLAPRDKASILTYAPVQTATAPGQVSLDEALDLYRVDKISRGTGVYGVIGDPIGHSLSPVMQNAGFQARRIDAVYFPFLVRDLKDFVRAIRPVGIRGFSVTIPHKEKILEYLDECDGLAEKIGAVNTVDVRRSGKLCGYNTDYVGVLRTLQSRIPLNSSRVLIVGAGGVARAVAFALAQAGGTVCVWARRMEQAKALARTAGAEIVERRHLRTEFFDAIVNATPVGMYPHTNESPLAANELNCRLAFDTIYRPQQTKLLQLAASRGIQTVSGVDMFVAQGTAQWELWTGRRAPEAAMRAAVLRALGPEKGSNRSDRSGSQKKAKR